MSSRTTVETTNLSGRTARTSLVFPVTAPVGGGPRKKPRSVTWERELETGDETDRRHGLPRNTRVQAILRAILPGVVAGARGPAVKNALTDFVLLGLSFAAVNQAGWLLKAVTREGPPARLWPGALASSHFGTLLLFAALVTLLNHSDGVYRTDLTQRPGQVRGSLGKSLVWGTLLTGAASLQPGMQMVTLLICGGLLAYPAMLGWRDWQQRRVERRRASGQGVRNVLVVGAGKLGQEVAQALENPGSGRAVVGLLDESSASGDNVCGKPEDLARIARANFVDEVIVAIPHQREVARRVIQEAQRCRLDVRVVPDFFGHAPEPATFQRLGKLPLLTLHEEPVPVFGPFLKRVFDVASSAAALLMTTPLLAAIALAIKHDSPGAVLYGAPRAGRKGRTFLCYKFRTMIADADRLKEDLRSRNERRGPFFKIADDPRVTRVGRFLRRYSLDGLPQLWNVLRGEMSLVGPRPHPLDDCRHYHLEHLRRLDVTPGITGLWQVTARGDPSFQRGLALDLEYIERWSFWMDLQILCRTVVVVLQGGGA